MQEDATSRIFAFVDDLFFFAKIQETARKLNVKVEFVKNDKELIDRMKKNGEELPSLLIFDLNNSNARPLTVIPKLKAKLKKGTSIIGFLSHVQGDLKQKAHEAGCDMVLPRSAFSQNLPQLLRRHGAPEEETLEG
ncbi:MAG: response regulator [Acidobacteria bacterium]|nr:response regulator [Acidobacteriota bacterium]MBV9483246.1 response regulator [Acidobacteriota bacterium]